MNPVMKVQVLPHGEGLDLPRYETALSAGMDLRAAIDEPLVLQSLERTAIPTGLIIVIVHFVVKRREERRTEALAIAADEMGLIFKPEGDDAFHQSLPEFPLFQIGRKQLLKNLILADTPELKMGLFDYCFTVGHGKHKKVRKLSVVVVRSADLHAPSCHLRPSIVFWDPIGALFGKQDVNFADHPEFSKAFVLKTDSEEETRAFFDQGLLDFFIKHADIFFVNVANNTDKL